jgi:VWFA-related protein
LVRPLILLCATAAAQAPLFRVTAPEVFIPVTVRDAKGQLADGLTAADFEIYDGGVRRTPRVTTPDSSAIPLAVVFAVQANSTGAAALLKINKAGSLVEPLITGERGAGAVVAYSGRVYTATPFTRDGGALRNAFRALKPDSGKTARMLDAVSLGIEMLSARPAEERRVLIVMGESRDRGSEIKLAAALEQAQRAAVTIYAFTYSAYVTPFTAKASELPPPGPGPDLIGALVEVARLGAEDAAGALASFTGGRKQGFATLKGLEQALTRGGEELHGQYLVTCAASSGPGYHRLEVRLPRHPSFTVQARPGYWVEPERQ